MAVPAGSADRGLTRSQVAKRLGVSIASVRRREGQTLFPVRDERGVWRFEQSQVERLEPRHKAAEKSERRRTTAGQVAARVFEMFAEGFDLRDIVPDVEVTPAEVRKLYREWLVNLEEGERLRESAVSERRQQEQERKIGDWVASLRS